MYHFKRKVSLLIVSDSSSVRKKANIPTEKKSNASIVKRKQTLLFTKTTEKVILIQCKLVNLQRTSRQLRRKAEDTCQSTKHHS